MQAIRLHNLPYSSATADVEDVLNVIFDWCKIQFAI